MNTELPVAVRNLERLTARFDRLTGSGAERKLTHAVELPAAPDQDLSLPLGVRRWLPEGGYAVGELAASPSLNLSPYERRFTVQVTPYQVYLKLGHFQSLAWVVDLATGAPVADAEIMVFRALADGLPVAGADARRFRTDAQGLAVLPGTADMAPDLSGVGWRCDNPCQRWFVQVRGDAGLAVLPVTPDYRVDLWRASRDALYLQQNERFGHARAWGFTAQGVYRPGDTVRYQLYVRDQDNLRWIEPPLAGYTLEVRDAQGRTVQQRAVTLSEHGSYHDALTLPKTSSMGWFDVVLSHPDLPQPLYPLRFLVTEFEPSPFRVSAQPNGARFPPGAELRIRTGAVLHGGGAYTGGRVSTVVRLQPAPPRFEHPLTREFEFSAGTTERSIELARAEELLDGGGEAVTSVLLGDVDDAIFYGNLQIESAVQDDRGRSVAARAEAKYHRVSEFVGLQRLRWVEQAGELAEVEVIVAGLNGSPLAGEAVSVRFERRVTRSARVRGAGNAFLQQFVSEWEAAGECVLTSADGAQRCAFTPALAGRYRAVARLSNGHTTELGLWVSGSGTVVWADRGEDGVPLIPDRAIYSAGDTAQLLVRNPLPGAQALVTVERYGVRRQFVTTLEGSAPILEVPLTAEDAPGVYVSVSLFSPRAAPPPAMGAGTLDLGKPAFRVGYVALSVQDEARKVPVDVQPDRSNARPGETISLRVRAEPDTDLTLVVLDEAVLALIANGESAFDAAAGFDGLHGVDVDGYSLMRRLIGGALLSQKGASPGGDGGAALAARSVRDYVAHWQPGLRTDRRGRAEASFVLPDNLTGWRVLAVATHGWRRFGLGQARVMSTLDTEIRPVLPNQVALGDRFDATFAVSNRTAAVQRLRVTVDVQGASADADSDAQAVTLQPFGRTLIRVPVVADQAGSLRFTVRASGRGTGDALVHTLPVIDRRAVTVTAVTGSLSSSAPSAEVPVRVPDVAGGTLRVGVSASVLGQLDGAVRYLRDYPYTCWEQKLARGVGAQQHARLRGRYTASWPDHADTVRATVAAAADHQAPNGGMTYFVPEDQRVSPYLSAVTALMLPWLAPAPDGGAVLGPLQGYLQSLLRNDHFDAAYGGSHRLAVRAMAVNALARDGQVGLDAVNRLLEHAARLDPFALANLLQAAQHLNGAPQRQQLRDLILARLQRSSGSLRISGAASSPWLHSSPARDQCAVLAALSGEVDLGAEATALARGVERLRTDQGGWANTQENVFCLKALADYAERFEVETPGFEVAATLGAKALGTLAADRLDARDALEVPLSGLPKAGALQLAHRGQGRAYFEARLRTLEPALDLPAQRAGLSVARSYLVRTEQGWRPLRDGERLLRGDVVQVHIDLHMPAAHTFVVVDDPVPGGMEPIDARLATAMMEGLPENGVSSDFYHRELGHRSVRFYAERTRAGQHRLSYAAQVVATGRFVAPGTRAEAMYEPDVYGVAAPAELTIGP